LSRLGIVTGLPREAAMLRGFDGLVRCEGPGPTRARRAAEALIAAGAETLVSFGVAGALDPALRPGDVIAATEAIAPDGTRYTAVTPGFGIAGAIVTREAPVADAAAKRRLFAETGAIAVDMESSGVAAAAKAARLRFMAVRAIADPADRALPRAAVAAMRDDGSVDYLALILRPWDWPRLPGLGRDWGRARRALRDVARGGRLVL
jgi:adenosylhomocysteine nucleosidase